MKKIILIIISIFLFSECAKAVENKFYLGERIDGIYIITDKGTKKVFAKIKKIHRTDTNELVYCTEPGTVLSSEFYEKYYTNSENPRLSESTMNKIRLIAHYGYMYENHTDIKWYAITQFLIWKEVLPNGWDLYFVNSNKERNDTLFVDEINEINNLVNNHKAKPNINGNYSFNYKSDIDIVDSNGLINKYNLSSGTSINNVFKISNLLPGIYNIEGTLNSYKQPAFYYHETGQDVFDKGDAYDEKFSFNLKIMGGKIKINECNQKTFENMMLGGTYEILDKNNEVYEIITCNEKNCLSQYLPVGEYIVRVKNISEDYILNENLFKITVNDEVVSEQNICFLEKEKEQPKEEVEETIEEIVTEEKDEILVENNENLDSDYEEIYMPSTYKLDVFIYVIILVFTSIIGVCYYFYENHD